MGLRDSILLLRSISEYLIKVNQTDTVTYYSPMYLTEKARHKKIFVYPSRMRNEFLSE